MKGIIKSTKRIKRIMLVMILITILALVKVSANTINLTRNKIDGIYAIAPLSDRTHLYNLEIFKLGTDTAYCIEIGKPVSDTYTGTLDMNEASRVTNISIDKINYIRLIAHFGYGFRSHSDYKYYMAAQELIWESLNNIDITWTNELDTNGPKINIETYKNEIKSLINKYNSTPTLPETINCKIGDNLTLTDNNKSLDLYTTSNKGKGNAYIQDNKTFIINVANNYIGEDKIEIKTSNNYNGNTLFYYANNYQSLLTAGNVNIKTKTINLNITGETLTTNLIDKDNKSCTPSGQATLIGAQYELYDKNNNLITTFTTDNTCTNTIPNLYYDTYYIKQIKASTGYKINDKLVEINLTKDNTSITLEEEVIKSNIEINKLYEIDDNYQKEEGVEFNIYDYNNILYKTITTTKNKDIVTLPYGSYIIKQMTTSYGYDMVKDIIITINENTNPEIKYDLVDKQIKSILHITTKDNKTKINIKEKNIKYKLKNNKTNKYIYTLDNNNKKTTIFTTNSEGELTIPVPLPYGEYTIEQISSPRKYLKNDEVITIKIDENSIYSYIDNQVVINVDYYNEPIIGRINIATTIETINNNNIPQKKELRPNIEVELYKDNKLVNNYKTDDNGKLTIDNLPLGNYCIKEKNNSNKKCLELINTDNITPIIEKDIELKIINNLSLNSIIPIPNTLSNKNNSLIFILITIVLIGAIIYKKKINNINN
ncbi:MAG: SpaA isopeptide-forming pilin-related protein [Bacilli bacterium]|nr:SpaA isopeptide-forming pilin-related protein [Bacilli bacterium]